MLPARVTGGCALIDRLRAARSCGRRGRRRAAREQRAAAIAVRRRLVAEEVLEPVAALLHPDEREAELDDGVADDVERAPRRRGR